MKVRRRLSVFVFALLAAVSSGQSTRPEQGSLRPEQAELAIAPLVHQELDSWRTRHGESWQVKRDHGTGWARLLHGGARRFGVEPTTDSQFVALARQSIVETVKLHGVDLDTLVLDGVTLLPLGLAGSTDKMSVRYHQEFDGTPVLHGTLHVLLDFEGRLLSVDSTAVPALGSFDTKPAYGSDQALLLAAALFELDTAVAPTRLSVPRLAIDRVTEGKLEQPRLVWEVSAFHHAAGFEAEGYRYILDARSGGLLSRARAVHNDVSGKVRSLATPGTLPNTGGNPPTTQDMPYLLVTSSQGNAVTDASGNFTIPGASAPLNVTVQYAGLYADTVNQAGADYSLTQNLTAGTGNTIVMNPGGAANTLAEANAFAWIGKLRDWTRSVNAADATSDFLAPANVNINDSCNAFYDGISVNFFLPGGSCVNTSFSSVVLHEMGHWMNDLYSSHNGGDGFGEGNADVFSMYFLDDPTVGADFFGPGTDIRDGNNTRTFCGDCCDGCYGQVHADGEVLGGALWKVRSRLKATHGTTTGGMIADLLFNAWMNGYDDREIKTIIEDHWLTLDDDNGNLYDGTPNYAEIDGGFRDQGFPGVDLRNLTITNTTQLADTTDEVGPYSVSCDVVANFAASVASADLFYSVSGAPFVQVAMSNAGSTWSADIPGQLSPVRVTYYVRATDSDSGTTLDPIVAPAQPMYFVVGTRLTHYFEDFESGENGWTHVDNVGTQDDWQLSSVVGLSGAGGKSGDPTSAFSGSNIWGNDLGPTGWNGAYANDTNNSLLSPVLDLSSVQGAQLRFQRWATVEWGIYDHTRVLVNGTEVWRNSVYGGDLIDTSWNEMVLDISEIADGNPSVQIEWNMRSDGGLTYGGWNIDDVEVLAMAAVPNALFSANTTAGPAPLDVDFSDASTGGATSWSWTFGDGGTSTAQNPSTTYNAPGTYDVSLTVSAPGGMDTETKTAYIVVDPAGPVAEFSGTPVSGAHPLNVAFSDLSSGDPTSWAWTFGDGGTSSLQNPSHLYAAAGTYDVTLTVTGPGGVDGETKLGYVVVDEPAPVAAFQVDRRFVLRPRQVNFFDLSSGPIASHSWDFGDGATSSAANPSHVYRHPGLYTVSLTVIGPGGVDTLIKVNHILVTDLPPVTLAGRILR